MDAPNRDSIALWTDRNTGSNVFTNIVNTVCAVAAVTENEARLIQETAVFSSVVNVCRLRSRWPLKNKLTPIYGCLSFI